MKDLVKALTKEAKLLQARVEAEIEARKPAFEKITVDGVNLRVGDRPTESAMQMTIIDTKLITRSFGDGSRSLINNVTYRVDHAEASVPDWIFVDGSNRTLLKMLHNSSQTFEVIRKVSE
ncbi:hypothetical protein AB4143_05020 [Vibrio breoganii]